MRAVVRPPSDAARGAVRLAFRGVVAGVLSIPGVSVAQEASAPAVALDREGIERLLGFAAGAMTAATLAAVTNLTPFEISIRAADAVVFLVVASATYGPQGFRVPGRRQADRV